MPLPNLVAVGGFDLITGGSTAHIEVCMEGQGSKWVRSRLTFLLGRFFPTNGASLGRVGFHPSNF